MRTKQHNNLRLSILSGILLLVVIWVLHSAFKGSAGQTSNQVSQSVTSPYIPKDVKFCGEEVPVQYFDVFESLERELLVNTYFHSQTSLNIKKSGRYFPVIEPILKRHNIPEDFKYLAVAESGLMNVVSPAGARGYWQIMEGTAKDYGLEVTSQVDERYHVEKATEAACKYLLDSYEYYQDWTMVAASYNVGRRGVNRQVDRQEEEGYYDLLFNEETARYVFRIIALKLVMENPQAYGFQIPKNELYKPIPHNIITVTEPVADLAEFAKAHGTNYKLLKYLNPWLREKTLDNAQHKPYLIKIPTSRDR